MISTKDQLIWTRCITVRCVRQINEVIIFAFRGTQVRSVRGREPIGRHGKWTSSSCVRCDEKMYAWSTHCNATFKVFFAPPSTKLKRVPRFSQDVHSVLVRIAIECPVFHPLAGLRCLSRSFFRGVHLQVLDSRSCVLKNSVVARLFFFTHKMLVLWCSWFCGASSCCRFYF